MSTEDSSAEFGQTQGGEGDASRALSAAARRALAEAAARRQEIDARIRARPREINGRGGLDPARFGDWEVKGIASDF